MNKKKPISITENIKVPTKVKAQKSHIPAPSMTIIPVSSGPSKIITMSDLAKARDFSDTGKKPNLSRSSYKRPPRGKDFSDTGIPGLQIWAGQVDEEFLVDLKGIRGIRAYKEMRDNDATVFAMLYVIEQLLQRTTIRFTIDDNDPEAEEKKMLVETALHDMSNPWQQVFSEILSCLPFGFAWMEITLKQRNGENRDPDLTSQYDDGLIGWKGIELRSQDSLDSWEMTPNGRIVAMVQQPAPDYQYRRIPYVKSLLFRPKVEKNNPEGKALTLDTKVPIPSGWTTMGDIQVGDQVYDETGRIRYVTSKSEVWKDRETYLITFSDGTHIKADEAHEWCVTTHNDRFNDKPFRKLTTKEIYENQNRTDQNYGMGIPPILSGIEQILPDPYLIGYWLGDGTTGQGNIAVSDQDFDNLKNWCNSKGYGFRRTFGNNARIYGFDRLLDLAQVRHKKHIPIAYLRSSVQQRLELLQGLMDSDGSVSIGKDKGCVFSNTNLELINGVAELVRSLGMVARVSKRQDAGRLGGIVDGNQIISTKDLYEVKFYSDVPVFKLPRKIEKQDLSISKRSTQIFIKSVEKVGKSDTVCIEVDSPSHLFLAGEGFVPTHNSILRGAYRSWWFKKRFEEIEGIAVERNLNGLPVLTPPEGYNLWNPNDPDAATLLARAEDIVRNIRVDQHQGVVLPYGWELQLLANKGNNIDTTMIIGRLEQRMAVTILADMLLIGQDRVGSFALVSSKVQLFSSALQGLATMIADQFNRHAIPRLMRANGYDTKVIPKMEFGPVEQIDLKSYADYVERLTNSKVLTPDDKLEDHLRQIVGFPEADEDSARKIPSLEPAPPGSEMGGFPPSEEPDAEGEREPVEESLPNHESFYPKKRKR